MIFVAVGTQRPFDRLIRTVDQWAAQSGRTDVFAQIGEGAEKPSHIQYAESLPPDEFQARCAEADIIVAHAGMGTILTSLQLGKPILVMPRHAGAEEPNPHQVHTTRALGDRGQVLVAEDEQALRDKLDHLDSLHATTKISPYADENLINTLRHEILHDEPSVEETAGFDGIICFGGEDWWYHNRGHYDMQIMGQLSDKLPVLYVNSIGMRNPAVKEGRVFLKRVARKLRSSARGLKHVRENFWVYTALTFPKMREMALGNASLAVQVRIAARRAGIRNPLIWVACPPAAELLTQIPHERLVYQRTDRFEEFPGVDRQRIEACDALLKERADATLFCSSLLYEQERSSCQNAMFVDHGVDYSRFAHAGEAPCEPEDACGIPRPRIGFVGGIDAHTFDPELFLAVARELSDCHFVMVGGCSLPEGWCELPNVHFLGQKPYEDVPQYMAANDVLIMPWNKNEWIKACNPVKLKEYLAVGRPVVTRDFYELKRYDGYVRVADSAQEFAESIRAALEEQTDAEYLRQRVQKETWAAKAQIVFSELSYARPPAVQMQAVPVAV